MSKLKIITYTIDRVLIVSWLCLLMIDRKSLVELLLSWNAVLLKVFICFQIYTFRDEVMLFLNDIVNKLPRFQFLLDIDCKNIYTLDGICTNDLVHYMTTTWKFAYWEASELFKMTPQSYKKLWNNLERVWILERGLNNARVLRQCFGSIEKLDHLSKFTDSDDITPLLSRDWNTAKVV